MNALWGAVIVAATNLLLQALIWAQASGKRNQQTFNHAKQLQRLEGKIDELSKEVKSHATLLARLCDRVGLGFGRSGSSPG